MKKTFLLLFALVSLSMMAQDTYPKFIDSGNGYTLDGIERSRVNTLMAKQIIGLESAAYAGKLEVIAYRWYSNGWDGNPNGYGYDTIARMSFQNHVLISADSSRLSSDDYKNAIWSIDWRINEVAAGDTVKILTFFYYNTTSLLSFLTQVDTSYTAYAGRPYRMHEVDNVLMVPVTYSSSNTAVASVNAQNGRITVAGKGETTITASFAGDPTYELDPCSASWKLVVKEGDHYDLRIISKERTEHISGWGGTYLAFDMIEVTEANCNDIYGDGKLSFNIATRTLTLNNYQRTYTQEEDDGMGWTDWLDYESGPLPLNVKVVGDCAIRHNSAGFYGSWDMNIIGDNMQNNSLTLEGRFPQLRADNQLTIDGVSVHAIASTPHPLIMCDILRVEDNSYLEAYIDIQVGEGEDPRDWGAMVGMFGELQLGDHTAILTQGVHLEDGTFIDADGTPALRVEIGPKVDDGIEEIESSNDSKSRKVYRNGILLIEKNGKTYTALGMEVK